MTNEKNKCGKLLDIFHVIQIVFCVIGSVGLVAYMIVYGKTGLELMWLVWVIGIAVLGLFIATSVINAINLERGIFAITKEHINACLIIICIAAIVVRTICRNVFEIYLLYTFAVATSTMSLLTTFFVNIKIVKRNNNLRALIILGVIVACVVCAVYMVLFLSALLALLGYSNRLVSDVVAILAAIIGGGLTLAGVAWTIRKTDSDRLEEERKKYIPYIKLVCTKETDCNATLSINRSLDLDQQKDVNSKQAGYWIGMKSFAIKNISKENLLLIGAMLEGTFYSLKVKTIIPVGETCLIDTIGVNYYSLENNMKDFSIVLSDVLGNEYECACEIKKSVDASLLEVASIEDGEEYVFKNVNFEVANIQLPIKKDSSNFDKKELNG